MEFGALPERSGDEGFGLLVTGGHGLYEVKDQGNHARVYNSVTNSMGDQVVAMLGWNWIKDTNTPRWTYYWLIAWGIAATMGEDIG